MNNSEIEKVLAEIRERVRLHLKEQEPVADPASVELRAANHPALDSLPANLSIIQRSWNKLPPLTSYRKGWVARPELWLKRVIKRVTHWFTWEQVNFNSATANSLQALLALLAEHDQALSELRKQLEQLLLKVTELQIEFRGLPKNGHFRESSVKEGQTAVSGGEAGTSERQQLLDAEIKILIERIEELRALKAEDEKSL